MDGITLLPDEFEQILHIKRDLHMHPELSKEEFRTSGVIRAFLEKLPCAELLKTGTPTGVLARIAGDGSGTEIALRADIDALPQTEMYESPWKSRSEGVMHACGHDFHTASLLGAVLILARLKTQGLLRNTVDLIFQPAEEGTTGAGALIDAGLFDRIHPRAIFGIHNWPSVESGKIVLHEGALMAAKRNMTIRIKGRGGHGSMPHLNVDPIVCAAAVVQSLQTIVSRNTSPLDSVVLSINYIGGGSPVNLVVDQVEMKATIRSLSDVALERSISRTEAIVRKMPQRMPARISVRRFRRPFPRSAGPASPAGPALPACRFRAASITAITGSSTRKPRNERRLWNVNGPTTSAATDCATKAQPQIRAVIRKTIIPSDFRDLKIRPPHRPGGLRRPLLPLDVTEPSRGRSAGARSSEPRRSPPVFLPRRSRRSP